MNRLDLESRYFELGNELPNIYPHLSFQNHCYWRISLDNSLDDKWNRVISSSAYKNLNDEQLKQVVNHLESYATDAELLQNQNRKSLEHRGKP